MPNTPKELYDYAIVGGGISGLSHAYHLAREGKSVLLLDAENCLTNASFNSTAIVSHDPDANWEEIIDAFGMEGAREIWRLSELSLKKLTEYAQNASPRFASRRLPAYIFAPSAEHAKELREQAELYKKLGGRATYHADGSAVHPLFHSFIALEEEGQTNNQAILRTLIKMAKRHGAKIVTHHPVEKLALGNTGVELVAKGTLFRAKEVILATGESSKLYPAAPQTHKKRTFVISFEKDRIPKPFKNSVVWDVEEPYHYIRAFRGRVLWVGGADVFERDYSPKKDYYAALEKYAREKLRLDSSFKRSGEWSGTFYPSGTKTDLPFVGRIDNSPVHVSYGFGGTGILMSFISGHLFSQWARGKETQYKKYFAPSPSRRSRS